jgi:dihydrofolate reductase
MAENRVIGRNATLPWHLPADLKRFKALTMGHAVIIGRKTFDAIGRVLPGRRWLVLTRDAGWHRAGVETAQDLDRAIAALAGEGEVFVAGGGQVVWSKTNGTRRTRNTRSRTAFGDTSVTSSPPSATGRALGPRRLTADC